MPSKKELDMKVALSNIPKPPILYCSDCGQPMPPSDPECVSFGYDSTGKVEFDYEVIYRCPVTNEPDRKAMFFNYKTGNLPINTWNVRSFYQGPGGCYIATASYGTPLHDNIQILRDWRDSVLRHNYFGRMFIKFYYKTSPPIADFIRDKNSLKFMFRCVIRVILSVIKK